MKKIEKIVNFCYLTIVISAISITSSKAQKAEIGIRFMPTFTSLDLNTSSGGTVKGEATIGYGVGGFIGFNFNEHVGIQGEVIYSSLTQEFNDASGKQKIDLRYVNVPLLLSLNTGKTKAVNLNIVAGPQLGIGLNSSVTSNNDGSGSNSEAVLSVKNNDIGFAYGIGLDFGLNAAKSLRLGLGYRGVIGLVDISDNSGTTSTGSYYVLDKNNLSTHAGYVGLSFLF